MTNFCEGSLLALLAGVIGSSCVQAEKSVAPALAHTHEQFSFVVNASYDETFPLFGAYEERKWAKGFNPQFIHPETPRDQPWMVFTTDQEGRTRVWTNTVFDPQTGHVQYVYFVTDTMVALIDIHLTKVSAAATRADVVYERTALKPEANERVAKLAREDANSGPKWAEAIHGYFVKARTAPSRTKK
jgi:hypothetical protein